MSIEGVIFTQKKLTSKGFGALGAKALTDGVLTGCAMEYNSATNQVEIGAGHLIAKGRVVTVEGTETVSVTDRTQDGYILLCIDLSASPEQISLAYSTTGPTNTQNINIAGTLYEAVIANVTNVTENYVTTTTVTAAPAAVNTPQVEATPLLWTNPNNSLSAGSVTLVGGGEFKAFLIDLLIDNGKTVRITHTVLNNASHYQDLESSFWTSAGGAWMYSRYVYSVTVSGDDAVMDFSTGYWRGVGSSSEGNGAGYMVPKRIYGLR